MVTNKIRAIRQILSAEHVMLFTKRGEGDIVPFGFGKGDLSTMMLVAVALKKAYENMLTGVNNAAVETGELHTLEALRKTVDTEIDNVSEK